MESGYPFTFVGIDSHCIDDYQKTVVNVRAAKLGGDAAPCTTL